MDLVLRVQRCLAATAILSLASPAFGATYHVSPSGDDAGPGSLAQPFQTIQKGVDMAFAGDTVYMMNGTYTTMTIMNRSGAAGSPITLAAYPGHRPVISVTTALHGINIEDPNSATAIGWIIIEGLEIQGANDGIKYYSGHDIVIRRNYFHDNWTGVYGPGSYRVVIDGNVFFHNGHFDTCPGAGCNQGSAASVIGTYNVITNNVAYGGLAYGFALQGSPMGPSLAGPEYAEAKFNVIANNTIAFQLWRQGVIVTMAGASDNRIENNIFFENGELLADYNAGGISFYNSGGNNTLRNNLFFASAPGALTKFEDTNGGSYTESGSINDLDPRFRNSAAFDFMLLPGSSAIDAALTIPEVTTDFNGTPRPVGAFDIGAFEVPMPSSAGGGPGGGERVIPCRQAGCVCTSDAACRSDQICVAGRCIGSAQHGMAAESCQVSTGGASGALGALLTLAGVLRRRKPRG